MQAVSKQAIFGWVNRWRSGGVEVLVNRPKSGRPSKADDEYGTLVMEVIEKDTGDAAEAARTDPSRRS